MTHAAPRVFGIGSEGRGSVLANAEARSFAGDGEVDEAVRVHGGLDGICGAIFIERDSNVIASERQHILIEQGVLDRIGRPEVRGIRLLGVDLRVELACRMETTGGQRKTS